MSFLVLPIRCSPRLRLTTREGEREVVVFSVCETNPAYTRLNIAVYGEKEDECYNVMNRFATQRQKKNKNLWQIIFHIL